MLCFVILIYKNFIYYIRKNGNLKILQYCEFFFILANITAHARPGDINRFYFQFYLFSDFIFFYPIFSHPNSQLFRDIATRKAIFAFFYPPLSNRVLQKMSNNRTVSCKIFAMQRNRYVRMLVNELRFFVRRGMLFRKCLNQWCESFI